MRIYIALTIGPIYNTMDEAKRTRAVWAASYFFSWFMRRVLEECVKQKMDIMLPFYSNEEPYTYKSKHGSGLYADRIYFTKNGQTTKDAIQKIVNSIFDEVEKKSKEDVKENKIERVFIEQYVNLHIIEKEITEKDLEKTYLLAVLNSILDNRELRKNFVFDIEKNPLQEYIINKAGSETFLARDAFGEENKTRKFRSIPEIATTTLERQDKHKYFECLKQEFRKNRKKVANDDIEFMDILKEFGFADKLRPFHKYYAVLYADGDNIGKMLEEIEKQGKDLKEFSKQLFEFGLTAEKEIAGYGGNGIYLGGEDILAFLPIACVTESDALVTQTFFKLIEKLDVEFENTVAKFAKENELTIPTLSYGIMISYIKHPLKESMHLAHGLLESAKKRTYKNSIALRFQKHSGQYTTCIIEKSKTCSTKEVYTLADQYSSTLELDTNELLSSIIHRFKDDLFFTLFYETAKQKRLDAFFANFFNEDIHQEGSPKNKFLMEVREFAEKMANDYPDKDDFRNIIFTVLRLIHFINSKRD